MHRLHVLGDDAWANAMDLENGSVEVLELIHHEGDRGHMSVVYHVIATGEVLHVCRSDMAWEDRMGELAGVH